LKRSRWTTFFTVLSLLEEEEDVGPLHDGPALDALLDVWEDEDEETFRQDVARLTRLARLIVNALEAVKVTQ